MNRFLALPLLVISFGTFSQNRYIINFSDKQGTPYTISNPEAFLSQRSIARREKNGTTVSELDLPVNPGYVANLAATGAKVRYTSRWKNCALVEATTQQLSNIESLPFVVSHEYVAPPKNSGGRIRKFKDAKESSIAAATQTQHAMLGINIMHEENLHGEGVLIAVLDDGFQGVNSATPFSSLFSEGRLKYTYDFVGHSPDVYKYDDHGTEVYSVMGAYAMGSYVGGAYKADYVLMVTEDVSSEYRVEEYNWLVAAERADSAGVDIINTSLGYNEFDDSSMDYSKDQLNGVTPLITWAASMATERGILVVCSAGNEGSISWKLVTPPADGEGVLAVGAVGSNGSRLNFSSIGPTADGRIKPDVMALGGGTSVVKPNGSVGTQSGTSVASPLVASLAAGVLQQFPDLTANELYDVIVNSADLALMPNNSKGYGIPHFLAVKNYVAAKEQNEDVIVYPNPAQSHVRVRLSSPDTKPIEVTLYDLAGKLVSQSSIPLNWFTNPFELDVSSLPVGMYLLEIRSSQIHKTVRLFKE